jgi:hypothetical protein
VIFGKAIEQTLHLVKVIVGETKALIRAVNAGSRSVANLSAKLLLNQIQSLVDIPHHRITTQIQKSRLVLSQSLFGLPLHPPNKRLNLFLLGGSDRHVGHTLQRFFRLHIAMNQQGDVEVPILVSRSGAFGQEEVGGV